MNYSWKDPQPGTATPLMDAMHQLQRTGQLSKPSKIVVSSEHAHHPTCPVHRSALPAGAARGAELNEKENVKPGSVASGGQKRPAVEPLAIPGSGGENKVQTAPLRTRDTAGTGVGAGNTHPDHKRKSGSPARGGRIKKRKYSSPLKRLYESDYRRQGLAKALFQTQYQMQYKDWLRESEGAVDWHGRQRKDLCESGMGVGG